jgi:predicted transcriptional regulator
MSQTDKFYNNTDRSEKIKKIISEINQLQNDVYNDGVEDYKKLKELVSETK